MQEPNIDTKLNEKILSLKKASKFDKVKIYREIVELSYKTKPSILFEYFRLFLDLINELISFDPNLTSDIKNDISISFHLLFLRIRNMSDIESFDIYSKVYSKMKTYLSNEIIIAKIAQYFGYMYWLKGALDKSLEYLNESLAIINKIDTSEIPERYTNIGYIYEYKGDFTKAQEFYNKGLDFAKNSNSEEALKLVYAALGRLNLCQGKYDLALEYFENDLSLYDKSKRSINQVIIMNNMAMCYYRKDNNDKALEILLSIKNEWVKELNPELYYSILENIGAAYSQKLNFTEAYKFNSKVLEYAKSKKILPLIISSLHSVAHCNWKLHNLNPAIKQLQEALKYAEELGMKKKIMLIKDTLGKIYLQLDDFQQALNYFLSINKNIDKIAEYPVALTLQENISLCYEKLGKYRQAFEALKNHNKLMKEFKISKNTPDNEMNNKRIITSGKGAHYLFKEGNSALSNEVINKIGHPIIGNSKVFLDAIEKAILASKNKDLNVLLLGESGTGKESIAKIVHYLSSRASNPFIEVNSAVFTTSLAESSLFGHQKGAFTGATDNHRGFFEVANGGSLFFDEIGEMPYEIQSMLLRVLESKKITPIGAQKHKTLDFRLICATNKNLSELIRDNKFRFDLFQRINTIEIKIPPLRERQSDIPLLIKYYLNIFAKEMEITPPEISRKSLDKLCSYHYPGNIRELKNIIQRLLLFCNNNKITENDIFFPSTESQSKVEVIQNLNIEETEINLIKIALEKSNKKITHASALLGISPYALARRIKKYGL